MSADLTGGRDPPRFRPYPAYKDSGVEWLGQMTGALATSWRVYDNSGATAPRLVAAGRGEVVTRVSDRDTRERLQAKVSWMKRERLTRIGRIFVKGTLVDRAVKAAARDALALHKQAGAPVVVYRTGRS